MSKSLAAAWRNIPSPRLDEDQLAMTAAPIEYDREIFSPVKMYGTAPGHTTCRATARSMPGHARHGHQPDIGAAHAGRGAEEDQVKDDAGDQRHLGGEPDPEPQNEERRQRELRHPVPGDRYGSMIAATRGARRSRKGRTAPGTPPGRKPPPPRPG